MSNDPAFGNVAILGLGMIGGSLAKALRKHGLAQKIIGYDSNPQTLLAARGLKIIDSAANLPGQAVVGCELVLLAAPPAALGELAEQIAPQLAPSALVMDMASVKAPIASWVSQYLPMHVAYVPAHPIAGSEKTGLAASSAELFEKKRVIITPPEPLQGDILKKIMDFWQGVGARVEGMPADIHDLLYAHVSHLPQLLAFGYAPLLPPQHDSTVLAQFARLGRSSAGLWSEIFILNRAPLLDALDRYLDALCHIQAELAQRPADAEAAAGSAAPEVSALLFARIAASCLATTIMEAEKKNGFGFRRFGGTGFADVTACLNADPESDLERISQQSEQVQALVAQFTQRLKQLRTALSENENNPELLAQRLAQ